MTISSTLEPLDEVVSSLTCYRGQFARAGLCNPNEAVAHALETGEVPMRRAAKRLFVFAPKRIVIGPGDRIEPDDLNSWRSITITRSNGCREVFHGVAVDRAALEVQFKKLAADNGLATAQQDVTDAVAKPEKGSRRSGVKGMVRQKELMRRIWQARNENDETEPSDSAEARVLVEIFKLRYPRLAAPSESHVRNNWLKDFRKRNG